MTKENKFKRLRFCWLLLTLIEILVKFAGHLAGNSKSECHNLNCFFLAMKKGCLFDMCAHVLINSKVFQFILHHIFQDNKVVIMK